jgi:hypothetical protein
VMLASRNYPPGPHALMSGASLLAIDAFPDRFDQAPARGLHKKARPSRRVRVEDFDGARVPMPVINLIEREHGGKAKPLGWVRGKKHVETAEGIDAYPVYVFKGSLLVAIVAPLAGSPCVRARSRT